MRNYDEKVIFQHLNFSIMKTIGLFLAVVLCFEVYAQDNTKQPNQANPEPPSYIQKKASLVRPDISWTYTWYNGFTNIYVSNRYKFSHDSVKLGDKYYFELLSSKSKDSNDFNSDNRFFREKDNAVYEVIDGEESLIFDFNLEVGDSIVLQTWEPNVYSKLRVTETDSMTLPNGEKRKVMQLQCEGSHPESKTWIEGIGTLMDPIFTILPCGIADINVWLNCFYENDTLIYQNPFRSNCWETSGTEELNQNGIKLFPNPAYDALTIQLKGIPEIREMSIIVINTDGRVLSRNKLISEVSTLDTTQLLPGIYYITVNKNNQIVFSSTFVKIE